MDALLKMTHISVYNCLNFHIVLIFSFFVRLFGSGMSSTLLMSPLLAVICAIWISVWKGPPHLSVILVGGSMDVNIDRRLVLRDSFDLFL